MSEIIELLTLYKMYFDGLNKEQQEAIQAKLEELLEDFRTYINNVELVEKKFAELKQFLCNINYQDMKWFESE